MSLYFVQLNLCKGFENHCILFLFTLYTASQLFWYHGCLKIVFIKSFCWNFATSSHYPSCDTSLLMVPHPALFLTTVLIVVLHEIEWHRSHLAIQSKLINCSKHAFKEHSPLHVINWLQWSSGDILGSHYFNGHNMLTRMTHKNFSYITPDVQKQQNITIGLRKHGKKALHGLVYIKEHVNTLDLKCQAWGTPIRNTVWKSNKGSYGKIITKLVFLSVD